LGDGERRQIAEAAAQLGLTLSGFVRQSALQGAAVTLGRVKVRPRVQSADGSVSGKSEPPRAVVVADELDEPAGHWVDGELVRRG
jgi:hypothetical protein